MKIFTIGHSNHSFEKLLDLLEENNISMLVDVRSAPYSRYNPQFNKEYLEKNLPKHWIEYSFAGQYLGGRPSDPSCYKSRKIPDAGSDYLHEVDYPEVMKRQWFKQGIERLIELLDEYMIAIMCSEEDPAECHRHHLIVKYLMVEYPEIDIKHIRGDGNVIGAKAITKSLDCETAQQISMFESEKSK